MGDADGSTTPTRSTELAGAQHEELRQTSTKGQAAVRHGLGAAARIIRPLMRRVSVARRRGASLNRPDPTSGYVGSGWRAHTCGRSSAEGLTSRIPRLVSPAPDAWALQTQRLRRTLSVEGNHYRRRPLDGRRSFGRSPWRRSAHSLNTTIVCSLHTLRSRSRTDVPEAIRPTLRPAFSSSSALCLFHHGRPHPLRRVGLPEQVQRAALQTSFANPPVPGDDGSGS